MRSMSRRRPEATGANPTLPSNFAGLLLVLQCWNVLSSGRSDPAVEATSGTRPSTVAKCSDLRSILGHFAHGSGPPPYIPRIKNARNPTKNIALSAGVSFSS